MKGSEIGELQLEDHRAGFAKPEGPVASCGGESGGKLIRTRQWREEEGRRSVGYALHKRLERP